MGHQAFSQTRGIAAAYTVSPRWTRPPSAITEPGAVSSCLSMSPASLRTTQRPYPGGVGRLLFLVLVVAILVLTAWWISREWSGNAERVADAKEEVRNHLDRMGSELIQLDPDDDTALSALGEAVDRMNTARTQLAAATTLGQVRVARETARVGLYFIQKAREAMGLDPGPPIPK